MRHGRRPHRGMRRLAGLVLTAPAVPGVASLAACVPPSAGTVRVEGSSVMFTAAAGKHNDVTVYRDGADVIVRENGGITPGAGCTADDSTHARCTGTIDQFALDLGDGDDRAT